MSDFEVYYTKWYVIGRALLSIIILVLSYLCYLRISSFNANFGELITEHYNSLLFFILSILMFILISYNTFHSATFKISVDGGYISVNNKFKTTLYKMSDVSKVYYDEVERRGGTRYNRFTYKTGQLKYYFLCHSETIEFSSEMVNAEKLYSTIYEALYYKDLSKMN